MIAAALDAPPYFPFLYASVELIRESQESGVSISFEGTIGIALTLVFGLGAGAYMRFPDQLWIGTATMAVAGIGLFFLGVNHFDHLLKGWSGRPKASPESLIIFGIFSFVCGLIWYFWQDTTVSEVPTTQTIPTDPIARLAELGWTVKPGTSDIEFEVAAQPLPPMKDSAEFFRQNLTAS